MYIIVCQTFNIHTILIFTKYFYRFLYRTQVVNFNENLCKKLHQH